MTSGCRDRGRRAVGSWSDMWVSPQMFNDDIQTKIHTAETLVPEPSVFEFELATEDVKRHKSSGIHQIPSEMLKAGARTIHYEIHKHISIWNKEELPEEWKGRSLYLSTRRMIKQTVVIVGAYQFCQLHKNFVQYPAVKVNSICTGNY